MLMIKQVLVVICFFSLQGMGTDKQKLSISSRSAFRPYRRDVTLRDMVKSSRYRIEMTPTLRHDPMSFVTKGSSL